MTVGAVTSSKSSSQASAASLNAAVFGSPRGVPLPSVLTIQSGINKLRYATLLGIKQAKNKPLRKVSLDDVKSTIGANLQKIEKLYVPQRTKKTEMLEGSPGEIAKKLVDKLRNDVRVI